MRRSRRNQSYPRLSESSGEEWSPYGSVYPRSRARRKQRSASAPSTRSPPPLSSAARRTRSVSVCNASADGDGDADADADADQQAQSDNRTSDQDQSSENKYSTFPNEFCGEDPFKSPQTLPILDGPFPRKQQLESHLKDAFSQRNTQAVIPATNFERHSATSSEQPNSNDEDMPSLFPEVHDDNGIQIDGNKPPSDKTEFTGASTSRNSKWFLRSRESINYQEHAIDEECFDDTAAQPNPMNVVADAPVPEAAEGHEEYAVLTAPPQLAVEWSSVPGAGLGVWTRVALPERTRFGPYTGERTSRDNLRSCYSWQIMHDGRVDSIVDAWDASKSNWMRFVNCSRHVSEQNVRAYQRAGSIFYRTTRAVKAYEELLVWYGENFARGLHIFNHFDPKPPKLHYLSFPCGSCERIFKNPLHLHAHFLLCKNNPEKKTQSLSSLHAVMTIGAPGKTYVINQSATSDNQAMTAMCTNEDETHERSDILLSSEQKGPTMTISPEHSASKNHNKPRRRRYSSCSTVDLQSVIEKHGPDSYSHTASAEPTLSQSVPNRIQRNVIGEMEDFSCNVDKSLKQSKTARKAKSLPNLRGEECNRRPFRIRYKNLDIDDTDEDETDFTENTQDVHTSEETSSLSNTSVSRSNEFRNPKCIHVESTNNDPQSTLRSYSSQEKRTTKKKRKITKSLPPILQEGNNALDPKKIAKSLQTGNPQTKEFERSSRNTIFNRVVEMVNGCFQDSQKTSNSSTRKSLKDKRIASKKEKPICSSQELQLSKKSKHKSIGKKVSDTSGVQRYNKSRKRNDSNEDLNNCEVPSDKISLRKSKSLSNLHDSPTSPLHTKNNFIESRQKKLFEEKSGTDVSQAAKIKTKRSKSVRSIQKRNKLPSKTNVPKTKREKTSTRKSLKDKGIASKKEEPICSSQELQLSKKSKHKSIGKKVSDTSGVQRYNKSRKRNDSNEDLNNCEVPSDKISLRKSKSLSNLHDSPTSPLHTKNNFIESRQKKLFEEKSGTDVSQAAKIKTKRSKSVRSIQKRNKLPSKTNVPKTKREKIRDVSKCSTTMLVNTSIPKISSSMNSSIIHGSKADLLHTKINSKQVNQAGSCEEEKESLTRKRTVDEFPKRAKSLTNLSDSRNLETELPAVKCSSVLSLVNDSQDSQDAPFTDHYPKELSKSSKVKSLPNVNSTPSKRSKHHAIKHSPKNTGERCISERRKRSKSLSNLNVHHSVELNALKKSKRYQKKTASALDLTTSAEFETITNIESSGDESEGVSFDETRISKVEHLKKASSDQDVSENVKVTSDPIKGDLGKTSQSNINKLASGFKDEDGINELMKAHCLFAMQQLAMTNLPCSANRSADSHTKSHCVICDTTFTNSSDLKKHTLAIHRDYTFPCSDCEATFLTLYALARHRVMHTGERPYRCDACKKTFFSSMQYLIHRSKHTKQKPFQCVKCSSQFSSFNALKYHMAQHMTSNQHVDDTEDLSQKEATKGGQEVESIPFPTTNSSLSHSSDQEAHLVRGEEKPDCHQSIAPSIRHIDEHQQNSINDKVYRCEVCKIAFACLEVLKTHRLTHTPEPDHHCPTCNAVFDDSSNLESHVGSHLQDKTERQGNADFEQRRFIKTSPTLKEEKKHECAANITPNPPCSNPHHSEENQCGRCKMQTSDVTRVQLDQNHISIVNEGIGCEICNAPSLPPGNLEQHICLQTEKSVQPCYSCGHTGKPSWNLQIHTKPVGEQPYRCQECNMSFVNPHNLRIHTPTHHSANVIPCPVCKKTFTTKRSYERHERAHDDTKPYDCDICDREFKDRISFVRHAYSHLNIEHKD